MRKTKLIIPPRKSLATEINPVSTHRINKLKNQLETADELRRIRDEKVYLKGEFKNFKEYCEHIGITYLCAYRKIKMAKDLAEKSGNKLGRAYEGYLYLIQCHQFIKIGIAQNPMGRISSMQSGNPYELKLIKFFKVENMLDVEKRLHRFVKDHHVRGEWFKLPADCLKRICDAVEFDDIFKV